MSQDFRPHPVLVNYEASSDGVIRNSRLKKPIGRVNNRGYLMFGAGKKKYYCHRIAYECFYGLIKSGLVIDHIDSCPLNNKVKNLQAVTQSENIKKGLTGKNSKHPKRPVKSVDLETNEEKVFQSMNSAEKYFDICRSSVRFVAEGIQKSAISKRNDHRIKFSYTGSD